MSTIMPGGESLRQAVKWISGQLEENPQAPIGRLVSEASQRFDLTPLEGDFLFNFYRRKSDEN